MRLLSYQHIVALRDPRNWSDNPFAAREARRDAKRKQPLKSFAWMGGTILIAVLLTLRLLYEIHRNGHGVPWYLGGEFATTLCIVTSGCHIYFISGAARKHTLLMFATEAYRNTLPGLLTTPIPPFQMVIQSAVYPWLAAMRLAIVLLPVYVLYVGLQGITWLDLVMLYVVFALIALQYPLSRRPALSDSPLFLLPGGKSMNAARTMAAYSGTAQGGGGNTLSFLFPVMFVGVMISFLPSLIFRGGAHALYTSANRYLPDTLLLLTPTVLLSWPLMFARGLVTPLDWFGTPIPPLVFVPILIAAARYLQAVRTSEFLSVGAYRELALLETYIPRRRWEARLRFVQWVVLTGYLWRWAIIDGAAGGIIQIPGRTDGLAGLLYSVLFWGAMAGIWRGVSVGTWLRGGKSELSAPTRRRLTTRLDGLYILRPLITAILFYGVCCLLARTTPFPPMLPTLAVKMLVIGLAGSVLSLGAARSMGHSSIIFVMVSPFLAVLILIYTTRPEAQSLLYLSPIVGLLQLRDTSPLGLGAMIPAFRVPWRQPGWQVWPIACSVLGILLYAGGSIFKRRRFANDAGAGVVIADPTQVGAEVFLDPAPVSSEKAALAESPLARKIVEGLQRVSDNAVMTKELRVRLRAKPDTEQIRGVGLILAFLTLVLIFIFPMVADLMGGAFSGVLFGSVLTPNGRLLANTLACYYLVVLIASPLCGLQALTAFSVERAKSTLGFMVLTPMKAAEILFGKAAGMLLPGSMIVISLVLWTLLLTIISLPFLGPIALAAWAVVTFTAACLLFTVGTVVLAGAALFVRMTLATGGWVWFILFMVGIQVVIPALVGSLLRFSSVIAAMGLEGRTLWLLFLLLSFAVSALAILFGIEGVRRMRKRDISFESSKRET